jgi:hypothetical protein
LEKRTALFTVHELLVALDKPAIAKNIVIATDPNLSKSPEDHVIKIKHDLDDSSLKIIEPICEKRNLKIERISGAFVIH